MTDPIKLAPVNITAKQREWIDKECERTGNGIAVIIRSLIQDSLELDLFKKAANGGQNERD